MEIVKRLLNTDVKKPTALIHFQRNLSSLAQRAMTLAIFNAQETEPDKNGNYSMRARFAMEFGGWGNSNNYPRVYEVFREIHDNKIIWNFLEEDRTLDELVCSFFITVGFSKKSGIIKYRFHPDIEPIIKNPSVYAKLKLIMLAVLADPKHAYPLYEFIADAYSRGAGFAQISLEKLKEYLGISAVSYTDFKDFKKWVLRPCIKAINEYSDYTISYETTRTGRNVTGLIFYISRKPQWQQPLLFEKPLEIMRRYFGTPIDVIPQANASQDDEEVNSFIKTAANHGVDERAARIAIDTHGKEGASEILEKVLRDIERRENSGNPVKNKGAYLARCLHEGFGKRTSEERKKATVARTKVASIKRSADAKELLESIQTAAIAARRHDINAGLDAMTPPELDALRAMFAEEVEAGKHTEAVAASFRVRQWKTPGLDPIFRRFAGDRMGIKSEEEYQHAEAKRRGYDFETLKKDARI